MRLAGVLAFFRVFFRPALQLWPGILTMTVLARATGRNGCLLVLRDTWLWTGVILCPGLPGLAVAIGSGEKCPVTALLTVACCHPDRAAVIRR